MPGIPVIGKTVIDTGHSNVHSTTARDAKNSWLDLARLFSFYLFFKKFQSDVRILVPLCEQAAIHLS